MAKLFLICSLALTAVFIRQTDSGDLKTLFLGLNYQQDIRSLFNGVEKDPNFRLRANRGAFMKSAEFYARYLGKSSLYIQADSIVLRVLTCNDMSTFFKEGANNCKSIKVLYYLKDTAAVNTHYRRINQFISEAIASGNPGWKNHDGAAGGVYFLSEKIYPFITVNRHHGNNNYLSVEYTNYDQ